MLIGSSAPPLAAKQKVGSRFLALRRNLRYVLYMYGRTLISPYPQPCLAQGAIVFPAKVRMTGGREGEIRFLISGTTPVGRDNARRWQLRNVGLSIR